jgi:hypothetical protein
LTPSSIDASKSNRVDTRADTVVAVSSAFDGNALTSSSVINIIITAPSLVQASIAKKYRPSASAAAGLAGGGGGGGGPPAAEGAAATAGAGAALAAFAFLASSSSSLYDLC